MQNAEQALLTKAASLQGLRIGDLLSPELLPNRRYAKGIVGHLMEYYLGASAGSRAIPDFPELGIELKTVPMNQAGVPLESTYLCKAPIPFREDDFMTSAVYQKLARVLWIPVIMHPTLEDSVVGKAQYTILEGALLESIRTDWEEISERLMLGEHEQLHASHGVYLHLRPKAADSTPRQSILNTDGLRTKTVAKGFYLRREFVMAILSSPTTLSS